MEKTVGQWGLVPGHSLRWGMVSAGTWQLEFVKILTGGWLLLSGQTGHLSTMILLKRQSVLLCLLFTGLSAACGDLSRKPVDARTRERIDSTANAQIRIARDGIDSFYKINHDRLLRHAMDSLTAVRRLEIEAQIRSVKK